MMLPYLTFMIESTQQIHGDIYHECEMREHYLSMFREYLRMFPHKLMLIINN